MDIITYVATNHQPAVLVIFIALLVYVLIPRQFVEVSQGVREFRNIFYAIIVSVMAFIMMEYPTEESTHTKALQASCCMMVLLHFFLPKITNYTRSIYIPVRWMLTLILIIAVYIATHA